MSRQRFSRGRAIAGLVALALGLTFAVSGCGGEDEPKEWTNDAGYPYDEAKVAADGIPVMSELTADQKAEAIAIAKRDPHVKALLEGHEVKWGKAYPWSRYNGELLGAGVDVKFSEPVDLSGMTIPTIENIEELYGKQGEEGVVLEEGPPYVEPEVGTMESPYTDVRSLSVMVDLEQGQVAQVLQTG